MIGPSGPEILLSLGAFAEFAGNASTTRLANGNLLVAYEALTKGVIREVRPDGTPVGQPVEILGVGFAPQVNRFEVAGLADGGFVVTWAERNALGTAYEVKLRLYDEDRAQVFPPSGAASLSPTAGNTDTKTAVLEGGRVFVTWNGPDDELLGQMFRPDGTKVGAELAFPTTFGTGTPEPTALPDGDVLVTWRPDALDIAWQIIGPTGVPRGPVQRIDKTGAAFGTNDVKATVLPNGQILLLYRADKDGVTGAQDANLEVQRLSATGQPVGRPIEIAFFHPETDRSEDRKVTYDIAPLPGGGFAVAFSEFVPGQSSGSSANMDVYVSLFTEAGEKMVGPLLVNEVLSDEQLNPQFQELGGKLFLTFTDAQFVQFGPQSTVKMVEILPPESLIRGTGRDDVREGTARDDVMLGFDGDDRLNGAAGEDILQGGAGNDTLVGGSGEDQVIGEAGFDVLNGGSGNDQLFGGAAGDTVRGGDGADIVHGGDNHDRIFGEGGADTLQGEQGRDQIFGDAGDDLIHGGPAGIFATARDPSEADRLSGGDGVDTIHGGNGDDILRADGGDAFRTDNLHGGLGNDTLFGGTGRGNLAGEDGDDRITGGTLADLVTGGRGDDILKGRGGEDQFLFAGREFGRDTILDFRAGQDEVRILGTGLSFGNGLTGRDTAAGYRISVDAAPENAILLRGVFEADLDPGDILVF